VELGELAQGVDGNAAHVLLVLDQPAVVGVREGGAADAVGGPGEERHAVLGHGGGEGRIAAGEEPPEVAADQVGVEPVDAGVKREGIDGRMPEGLAQGRTGAARPLTNRLRQI